jgi:hypothetical protein
MGRGGSRWGAGRPGWRRRCEHVLALDVRRLHRRGALMIGASSSWRWSYDGEPFGSIGVTGGIDRVRLAYVRAREGGEPEHFGYDIPVTRTPCHFGGHRDWFVCPWCQRRCALVYGVSRDGYFACRRCMPLGYASESEDRCSRLWRRMRKLEALLVDGETKPKRMHRRTFERICARMEEVDSALDAEFFAHAVRLFGDSADLSRLFGEHDTSTG